MASDKALTHELIKEVRRGDLPDINSIRDLLQRGADINGRTDDWNRWTPLMILARKEDDKSTQIIVELLKHENLDLNARDEYGKTALIVASEYGELRVVDILLKDDRVDVNANDDAGNTTLISANYQGRQEVVRILLKDDRVDVHAQR